MLVKNDVIGAADANVAERWISPELAKRVGGYSTAAGLRNAAVYKHKFRSRVIPGTGRREYHLGDLLKHSGRDLSDFPDVVREIAPDLLAAPAGHAGEG